MDPSEGKSSWRTVVMVLRLSSPTSILGQWPGWPGPRRRRPPAVMLRPFVSGEAMTPSERGAIHVIPHLVKRSTIAVDARFDDFRDRYESAVPGLDAERFE